MLACMTIDVEAFGCLNLIIHLYYLRTPYSYQCCKRVSLIILHSVDIAESHWMSTPLGVILTHLLIRSNIKSLKICLLSLTQFVLSTQPQILLVPSLYDQGLSLSGPNKRMLPRLELDK
jgi:hypothetical protein